MFRKNSRRENQNKHFMINFLFNPAFYEKMRRGHKWQYGACAYMLDIQGYKHTLRICNTYCFSTVAMVIRRTPQCYVVYTLPVFLPYNGGDACSLRGRP